ncbi:MAG: hypothetical protein KA137_03915 [Halioglobus sp.]|nr:hypothetical protein [Halioglobus sp.]
MKINTRAGRVSAAFLACCLLLPQSLWAADRMPGSQSGAVDENPHWFAMVGDFFVARPLGLVLTAGGTALWLVSLPFTLAAGNANETAETLVLGPAEQTFVRCLGCRQSGYTYKDIDQRQKQQQETALTDE